MLVAIAFAIPNALGASGSALFKDAVARLQGCQFDECREVDWLNDRLNSTDQISGGYRSEMANPVTAGAAFGMRLVFILAWLLALIPLCLWGMGRWAWKRRNR